MSKRLKKFICYSAITALVLGTVLMVYEQVGPYVAGEYYSLIWWGIFAVSGAVLAYIGWHFYEGIQSGYLLFDDMDD